MLLGRLGRRLTLLLCLRLLLLRLRVCVLIPLVLRVLVAHLRVALLVQLLLLLLLKLQLLLVGRPGCLRKTGSQSRVSERVSE